MLEEMQKQRIIQFENKYGTAISLRGSMNNLAVADELKRMATSLNIEILAEEVNFFDRYIAFATNQKQRLEYFLFLAGEYNRSVKKLEKIFLQEEHPVFN